MDPKAGAWLSRWWSPPLVGEYREWFDGRGVTISSVKPRSRDAAPAKRLMRLAEWMLARGEPFTRDDVWEAFPDDYSGGTDAKDKKWTRDKDALVEAGIPIEFEKDDRLYEILPERCHLPALKFTPEERAVLWMAGQAAMRLGAHPFGAELEAALRKVRGADPDAAAPPAVVQREDDIDRSAERAVQATVKEAMVSRKRIRMRYFTAARADELEREVDVYGFAWRRNVWFFVGYCHERKALRVFYPARVRTITINGKEPGKPDYQVPRDFDIRVFVGQKEWDFWVHAPREATVRFSGGLAKIASGLLPGGKVEAVESGAKRVTVSVRNLEGLVRQTLAWGPEAEVVAPEEARTQAQAMLATTLALSSLEAPVPEPTPTTIPASPATAAPAPPVSKPDFLRAVERLLVVIPFVAQKGKRGVPYREVLAFAGYRSLAGLWDDLELARETALPGDGGGDSLDIHLQGGRVYCMVPRHFARPPRLTAIEGAAILSALRALGDAGGKPLARAVERLRRAFPAGDDAGQVDTLVDSLLRMVAIEEPPRSPCHDALEDAIARHVEVTLEYFAPSTGSTITPLVEPVRLFVHRGHWYLEAWSVHAVGIRAYRVDRLSAVRTGTRTFEARLPTDPARLFTFAKAQAAELRFSARFGTFVRERFQSWRRNTDGTFSAERTVLGSEDGFVSWILGFGGNATIVRPEELRAAFVARATALRALYPDGPTPPS